MKRQLEETYFIAEIGVNHGGDLELAQEMVRQVADAGAHAAKFQTYKAEKLAHKNSPGYWDKSEEPTASQYDLFKKFDQFGEAEYKILAEECNNAGIDFISTPFDTECLPWLIPLMSRIKIASADLTNYLLLEAVSKYKKPVLLSVGASTDDEITDALRYLIEDMGVPKVSLLHCMLHYPTLPDDAFLNRIRFLSSKFKSDRVSIGYSDHVKTETSNNDQILLAIGLGAGLIEKHFTHDKSLKGNDHYHAVNQQELKDLMHRIKLAERMTSTNLEFLDRGLIDQQIAITNARRSLFYTSDLKPGKILDVGDFIAKRPGNGISPKDMKYILGKTLKVNVLHDQSFDWKDIVDGN